MALGEQLQGSFTSETIKWRGHVGAQAAKLPLSVRAKSRTLVKTSARFLKAITLTSEL